MRGIAGQIDALKSLIETARGAEYLLQLYARENLDPNSKHLNEQFKMLGVLSHEAGVLEGELKAGAKPVASAGADDPFVSRVREFMAAGKSKSEAISAAMQGYPEEHRAWRRAGGGNLQELDRPPGAADGQQTFPQRVSQFVREGKSKSEAVTLAVQHFPTEHRAWVRAGGGQL